MIMNLISFMVMTYEFVVLLISAELLQAVKPLSGWWQQLLLLEREKRGGGQKNPQSLSSGAVYQTPNCEVHDQTELTDAAVVPLLVFCLSFLSLLRCIHVAFCNDNLAICFNTDSRYTIACTVLYVLAAKVFGQQDT